MRNRILRWMRISLLCATATLMFGSLAWGQYGRYDNDDRNYRGD